MQGLPCGLPRGVDTNTARCLLGMNIFGSEEWMTHYNRSFTSSELEISSRFPWNEDVLNAPCPFTKGKAVKETHFAFLGVENVNGTPWTIDNLRQLYPHLFFGRHLEGTQPQDSALRTCAVRWYLMPLEIIPYSWGLDLEKQLQLLPAEYDVPFSVEEIVKCFLYHERNGIYLNSNICGRCRDISVKGRRNHVGGFNEYGISNGSWSDGPDRWIGLAASRIPPNSA
jgi:hypothetical protein